MKNKIIQAVQRTRSYSNVYSINCLFNNEMKGGGKEMETKNKEYAFRRFKVINQSNVNRLMDLCNEKNISREDLMLILKTLKLNEDIEQL